MADDGDVEEISRKRWTDQARKSVSSHEKEPCWICGRYISICHAHHLAPLQLQWDIGMRNANQESVWICPTHHALVHSIITAAAKGDPIPELDEQDREKVLILAVRGLGLLVAGALAK